MDFSEYVGIPYADVKHPGYNGLDCWHLVRQVLHEKFSIDIPCLAFGDPRYAGNLFEHFERDYKRFLGEWCEVTTPDIGDLILFLDRGVPSHAALMIDRSRFLHTQVTTGSVVESLDDYWKKRIHGIYRHESRNAGAGDRPPQHIQGRAN